MKLIAKVRVADFNSIQNFHLSEIFEDSYESMQPAIRTLTGSRSGMDAVYRYMARQLEPQATSQSHPVSQESCPPGDDPDEYPIDDEDGEEDEPEEAATERHSDENLSADASRSLSRFKRYIDFTIVHNFVENPDDMTIEESDEDFLRSALEVFRATR